MKKLLHRWFIEAMSSMALGLFGTLIIGLIINTIATYVPFLSSLSVIGETAQSLTGAAIGVAIAYGLKSPPLVIFSVLAVSQHAYDLGGAAASFIVSLIVIEIARLYQKRTKLDIIVTPLLTLIIGLLLAGLIGEAVGGVMTGLGDVIVFATDQRPFMMGILVCCFRDYADSAAVQCGTRINARVKRRSRGSCGYRLLLPYGGTCCDELQG